MRILHVISSAAAGGAEIYVKDLSIEMSKMGHDVFIAFIDRAEEAGRDIAFEANFLHELESANIQYDFIGKRSRKNPITGIGTLRRIAKKFSPDIVHSHLYYGSIFAWFLPKVKRIHTHHNIRLGAHKYIYKFLDMRVDAYIGICLVCTNLIKSVSRKSVFHIDNGVDASRLMKKVSYSNTTPVKLLFVGRLSEQKNLGLLIKSASNITDVDFEVVIAGEGPLMDELQRSAREAGVEEKIKFIGNSDNVKKLLHDADIFVMSSAWEGLPIAQIEATLTGLPVLVTDVGGCSEIVDHVGNGMVSEVDEKSFSFHLNKLIKDYPLRKKYHEEALRNSDKYTIKASVEKHINVYQGT
ncbi:glycosyltransferase [Halomonas alkalisoli]|uniref:glycosyltransferase n=1 Tax=Halomonas alkalisoli TaxID=2907158 RepID=UPI001F3F24A8|nr:glycosyltransferase [Halomonas alkalisoli]MCE9683138.1 glycosyltransferase [Halomonas alkalisoli]